MSYIKTVVARVATGDEERGGTTGEVYLGLAGMEFKLNSETIVDYEQASDRTYVLGEGSATYPSVDESARDNFSFAARNDPRITTMERAARHPVYVRLHPVGEFHDWMVAAVDVRVDGQDGSVQSYRWAADPGRWLGCEYGLTVHLD